MSNWNEGDGRKNRRAAAPLGKILPKGERQERRFAGLLPQNTVDEMSGAERDKYFADFLRKGIGPGRLMDAHPVSEKYLVGLQERIKKGEL